MPACQVQQHWSSPHPASSAAWPQVWPPVPPLLQRCLKTWYWQTLQSLTPLPPEHRCCCPVQRQPCALPLLPEHCLLHLWQASFAVAPLLSLLLPPLPWRQQQPLPAWLQQWRSVPPRAWLLPSPLLPPLPPLSASASWPASCCRQPAGAPAGAPGGVSAKQPVSAVQPVPIAASQRHVNNSTGAAQPRGASQLQPVHAQRCGPNPA